MKCVIKKLLAIKYQNMTEKKSLDTLLLEIPVNKINLGTNQFPNPPGLRLQIEWAESLICEQSGARYEFWHV